MDSIRPLPLSRCTSLAPAMMVSVNPDAFSNKGMHAVLNRRKWRFCYSGSLFAPLLLLNSLVLSVPGALGRDRLLDVGFADSLQLLVLRGAQNFLQLRRVFAVDGVEFLHLLHPGHRRIVLDRLEFGSLFLEDRQHLHLLFRRKF